MVLKVISYPSSYLNLEINLCTTNEIKNSQHFITEVIRNWKIKTWGKDLLGHLSPPMNEWRVQTADWPLANVIFLRDKGNCT